MEVAALVNDSHILLVVADNLDEVTHDIREEGHSTKHNKTCKYSLPGANWVVVSVANSTQGSQGIVAADNELVGVFFRFKLEIGYKRYLTFFIDVYMAEVEPSTADEIGDDDGNYNKPENLINIHEHVLSDNLFIPRLVFTTHQ